MKVEISEEEVDRIVIKDLKCSIRYMLGKDYDIHESLDNKANLFDSLCQALQYYSKPSEYQKFIESLKGKKLK